MAIEGRGVVLALGHVEEGAGRLARPVLRDDHRGAHDPAGARVLGHEDVVPLERVADVAREALHRPVDDPGERALVVRQVDGVEHLREPREAREVAPLGVPQEEHGGAGRRDHAAPGPDGGSGLARGAIRCPGGPGWPHDEVEPARGPCDAQPMRAVDPAGVAGRGPGGRARCGGGSAAGSLVLLGVARGDGPDEAAGLMADKVAALPDLRGRRRQDEPLRPPTRRAALLVVSQFTLLGDARKGNRPSFIEAAAPEEANALYERSARSSAAKGPRWPRASSGPTWRWSS